jgi:hypothetical protein
MNTAMNTNWRNCRRRTTAACVALVLLVAGILARGQRSANSPASEDYTRQLWNTQFLDQRPATPAATKTNGAATAADDALVGVTIWKLRPSQPADDQSIRVVASGTSQQWTPVRVGASLPLAEGEHVRISIEAARSGFLYVIDREQYADGTLGDPYLIFPTLRINSGDNSVRGGRVVEIPALADSPPYLTMRRSRPDQKAEMLTLVVSKQPLPGLKIGRDAAKLDPATVAGWVRQWGAKVERLESKAAPNAVYTKAEKQAGADHTRLLTHDEPLPQTLYKIDAKAGDPLLLDVPLQIVQR